MTAVAQKLTHEQIVAACWRRGELSWKLRPEQLKLKSELENPAVQLGVFNISRRWGKTYTLVAFCLEQAIRRKQKIRYGCAYLTDLEEFILPAFEQILDDCPPQLRPVYARGRKTWTFPNGSEIRLVGLDKNPNGIRGNALNIIIIDEAAFVANLKYVHTSVIVPATMKQKNIKVVFISTPPESPSHYFASELIHKAALQESGHYICLTIDSISDLTPAERARVMEEAGGEGSRNARREFFCEILVDETRAVIPEFTPEVERASVRAVDRPSHFDRYVGLDVGWKDATGGLFGYYHFDEARFVIDDELLLFKATSDTIGSSVREKEALHYGERPPFRRVSDHDARLLDHLAEQGLYFSKTEKTEKEKNLNRVRMWLKDGKVLIHPRCKHLLAQLKSVVWNSARTSYDRDALGGHFDLIDALVYLLRAVEWGRNPYPSNHGISNETHYTSHAARHSDSEQALIRAFTPRR